MIRVKDSKASTEPLEEIYTQYFNMVYFVAYGILRNRENAEDITQEVFADYFEARRRTRITSIKQYLMKMSRNKALNLCKKRKRELLTDEGVMFEQPVLEEENDDRAVVRLLEKNINYLPSEDRQVFILHVKAGLRFREISKVINMPPSSVHRRYKRAVRFLQERLKENG